MPAVARVGDAVTGGVIIEGSPDVFVNGKAIARQGDRTTTGYIIGGSSTVFANGIPVARVGDPVRATVDDQEVIGVILEGSPDVFAA